MTLAWLDISIKLVIIAHVVVSLLLVLVILMQRPKQEGLGAAFGSGMTDAAWGARTTDVLQKGTVYLGTLFFIFSLLLSILMGKKNAVEGKRADADGVDDVTETEEVQEDTPAEEVEPDKIEGFDEALKKAQEGEEKAPEAPEADSESTDSEPTDSKPAEAEPSSPAGE